MAHNFNNLLTVIGGNLDLALRALSKSHLVGADRKVRTARGGSERAVNLTRRLLVSSRRQELTPQIVTVNKVVADVAFFRRSLQLCKAPQSYSLEDTLRSRPPRLDDNTRYLQTKSASPHSGTKHLISATPARATGTPGCSRLTAAWCRRLRFANTPLGSPPCRTGLALGQDRPLFAFAVLWRP